MNNRLLRLLTASLVVLVLVLGAAACIGPFAPAIEETFEEITETLLTPEAAPPEAIPASPTPTSIPPSPTPETPETAYTNASWGLSMWYPEDWVYEEEEDQVTFATSEELIGSDEIETGAAMVVIAQDLEGDLIEDVVDIVVSFLISDEGLETGDTDSRTIGGQDGIIITFEGTPEEGKTSLKGFVAGAEYDGWAYLFIGLSALDDWPEYSPDLEAMLDRAMFSSRIEPTPVPGEAFTPDSWEPDDSLAEASLIEVGEAQTHNLHVQGDHDWLHFEADEGTIYVIETYNLGDDMDTIVYLYDEQENQLASDDDGGDEDLASRLRWAATEDGTLYVMIQDYDDAQAGSGTGYDVSLSVGEAFETDQYEPDDSLGDASQIQVGETQTHSLHVEGDHDWLYFEAEAGTAYIIYTSNLGSEIDTEIYLYDANGEDLNYDDDSGDEDLASHLEWPAAEDGTLYVMVRDFDDDVAGPDTRYDISVSEM